MAELNLKETDHTTDSILKKRLKELDKADFSGRHEEMIKEKVKKNIFRADPDKYFVSNEKGKTKFIPKILADEIEGYFHFKTLRDTEEIFYYNNGGYHRNGETFIKEIVNKKLSDLSRKYYFNEVLFQIQAKTYIERSEINKEKYKINLQNGILDINKLKLISHSPDIINTIQLPIHYDPDADCPLIKKFMEQILVKRDIEIIQELFGYILLKDYIFQKAFMFVGEGANGKSTLMNVLLAMLGKENAASKSLQDIAYNKFAAAELFSKLANIYPDLSSNALNKTGQFKMLTGNDMICAERKFGQPFTFVNYAKLIFSANELPEVSDNTSAFFRRWIIINFPNKFEDKDADKMLLEKLTTKEELSGLLNWSIIGLKRLFENEGFSHSTTTEEIRDQYIRMSDPIKAFVMDCITVDIDKWISKDDLYNSYIAYCIGLNLPKIDKAQFSKKLQTKVEGNISTERQRIAGKQVYGWKGIDAIKWGGGKGELSEK